MCNVVVSGKGLKITDETRQRTEEKMLEAISVFDVKPSSVHVTLDYEGGYAGDRRNVCEAVVSIPKLRFKVSDSAKTMDDAVDETASKIARRLRRHKTRVVGKKHKAGKASFVEVEADASEDDRYVECDRRYAEKVYGDVVDEVV